jgi:hypothetical protein
MPKFNSKNHGTKTANRAGGDAHKQSPELEFVSLILTSFVKDKFYESESNVIERLRNLITRLNPEFVAKSAIYARHEFGMRSVTHIIASELAKHISKNEWAKRFYNKIVKRPDDILEILSYHFGNNQKVSNSMKKGLGISMNKFDEYQLAKYKGENRNIKLVDAFNILHPKPENDKKDKIFNKLINGELKSKNTWESKISASNGDKEKKKQAWSELIDSGKIGYFALLRNLRNILEDAPDKIDKVSELLVNKEKIHGSLVLPFRFMTALKVIQRYSSSRTLLEAINKAIDISLDNVPEFDGRNLIVLDVSGSMKFRDGDYGSPAEIGALFAMALYKTNDCDFMTFDSFARYENLIPSDSILAMTNQINFRGGGTNLRSVFDTADKPYDRIIILTDGQGWMGRTTPARELNEYREKVKSNPYIYNFDLEGYGDMQFPENNVFCVAGFSEKVFDVMKILETNKKALFNSINSITI